MRPQGSEQRCYRLPSPRSGVSSYIIEFRGEKAKAWGNTTHLVNIALINHARDIVGQTDFLLPEQTSIEFSRGSNLTFMKPGAREE